MKFRFLRGDKDTNVKNAVELDNTETALALFLSNRLEYTSPVSLKTVHIGMDNQTGWDTYIVLRLGTPVGFTDGPLEEKG